jgi:hypothetical protein
MENILIANKDRRVKTTMEILNGVKYIKMAGLEEYFLNKVYFLIRHKQPFLDLQNKRERNFQF